MDLPNICSGKKSFIDLVNFQWNTADANKKKAEKQNLLLHNDGKNVIEISNYITL